MRLMLLLTVVPWLGGGPQVDLTEQALSQVVAHLGKEGFDPDDYLLEIVGAPELLPDHRRWHIDASGRPATVAGRVVDETGAVIPGASVELFRGRILLKKMPADDEGGYRFESLDPGNYAVRVTVAGFKQAWVGFPLEANGQRQLEIMLEVGNLRQTVTSRIARSEVLPDAIVAVVAVSDQRVRTFNVLLPPGPRRGVFAPLSSGLELDLRPVTRMQWQEAVEAAHSFYDAALRFEDGPERFFPFIDARRMLEQSGTTGGSELEVLARIAFYLDAGVLRTWFQLENLEYPEPSGRSDMTEEEALQLAMQTAVDARRRLREHLRELGAENRRHRRSIEPYLRRYLGEGLVGRLELAGGEVFVTRMLPWFNLPFDVIGGRFQLVGLIIDY